MKHWTTVLVVCCFLFIIFQVEGNSDSKENGVKKPATKHLKKVHPHHHHHHHHKGHKHFHHHHHSPHHHKHYKHHKHHHHHHHYHHKHQHHHHSHHQKSFSQRLFIKLKHEKEKQEKAQKYIMRNIKRDSLPQLLVSLGKGFLQLGKKLKKNKPHPKASVVHTKVKEPKNVPTVAPSVATPTPTASVQVDDDGNAAIGDAAITKWQAPPTSAPVPLTHTSAIEQQTPKIAKVAKPKKTLKQIVLSITPTPHQPTKKLIHSNGLEKQPKAITKAVKPKILHVGKPAKINLVKNAKQVGSVKVKEANITKNVEHPPNKVAMVPSPTESSIDQPLPDQFDQLDAPFNSYEVDSNPGSNIFINDVPSPSEHNIDTGSIPDSHNPHIEISVPSPISNSSIDSESTPPSIEDSGSNVKSTETGTSVSIDSSKTIDLTVQNAALKAIAGGASSDSIDSPTATDVTGQNVGGSSSDSIDNPTVTSVIGQNVAAKTIESVPSSDSIDNPTAIDVTGQNAASKVIAGGASSDSIDNPTATDVTGLNVAAKTIGGVSSSDSIDNPTANDVTGQNVAAKTIEGGSSSYSIDNPTANDATGQNVAAKTIEGGSSSDSIDNPTANDVTGQNVAQKVTEAATSDSIDNNGIDQGSVPGVMASEHKSIIKNVNQHIDELDQHPDISFSKQNDERSAANKAGVQSIAVPKQPDIQSDNAEKDNYYKGKVITPKEVGKTHDDQNHGLPELKAPGEALTNPVIKQNVTDGAEDTLTNPSDDIDNNSIKNSENEVIVDGEIPSSIITNVKDMDPHPAEFLKKTTNSSLTTKTAKSSPSKANSNSLNRETNIPLSQEIEDGEILPSQLQYNGSLGNALLNERHEPEDTTVGDENQKGMQLTKTFEASQKKNPQELDDTSQKPLHKDQSSPEPMDPMKTNLAHSNDGNDVLSQSTPAMNVNLSDTLTSNKDVTKNADPSQSDIAGSQNDYNPNSSKERKPHYADDLPQEHKEPSQFGNITDARPPQHLKETTPNDANIPLKDGGSHKSYSISPKNTDVNQLDGAPQNKDALLRNKGNDPGIPLGYRKTEQDMTKDDSLTSPQKETSSNFQNSTQSDFISGEASPHQVPLNNNGDIKPQPIQEDQSDQNSEVNQDPKPVEIAEKNHYDYLSSQALDSSNYISNMTSTNDEISNQGQDSTSQEGNVIENSSSLDNNLSNQMKQTAHDVNSQNEENETNLSMRSPQDMPDVTISTD